jgi:hypothetical protein
MFMTADFLYYRGKTAMFYGDKKGAEQSFRLASGLAQWWKSPLIKLNQISK